MLTLILCRPPPSSARQWTSSLLLLLLLLPGSSARITPGTHGAQLVLLIPARSAHLFCVHVVLRPCLVVGQHGDNIALVPGVHTQSPRLRPPPFRLTSSLFALAIVCCKVSTGTRHERLCLVVTWAAVLSIVRVSHSATSRFPFPHNPVHPLPMP